MLKSSVTSGFSEQAETTNELFGNLSISLDSKYFKQRHITPKPKLKRLTKLKSSTASVNTTTFCSRCRKETSLLPDHHGPHSIPEKEVDVKKSFPQRKVHFLSRSQPGEESESSKEATGRNHGEEADDIHNCKDPVSISELQRSFSSRRSSSIVGNNDFWLPQRNALNATSENGEGDKDSIPEEEAIVQEEVQAIPIIIPVDTFTNTERATSEEADVVEFFNNIFKETIKRNAKILHVATLLENSLITLTDEYVFECRRSGGSFEIMNAIPLRDIRAIMASDACTLIVLQVCRASTLTEFKEFVPGCPEKTESLISMMVYAISRINNGSLPDVNRLPLLSLPNYATVRTWYLQQGEEIAYCGIATAMNVSDPDYDFSGESFMMKTKDHPQFHPVSLLLTYGQFISKCNGGCHPETCKHSIKLDLKCSAVTREDHPWPNSVRLRTECHKNVILACSSKESAENLVEKLYCCIQPSQQHSMQCLTCILVTEYSLQLFRMTPDKPPLFGSPLLNLNISGKETADPSCFIDSEGVEAGDDEILQLHHRWQLKFLSADDKLRFIEATSQSDWPVDNKNVYQSINKYH